MKRVRRLVFVVLASTALFACESGEDAACSALMGSTPVRYVGHAFGDGDITLRSAGDGQVQGLVELRGARPEDPSFSLPATGTCRDGVAKLRLASADNSNTDVRILGGRLVLVGEPELLKESFGMWRANVQTKDGTEPREMHGYLRQRAAAEGAVAQK